jgi:hypothetical protein
MAEAFPTQPAERAAKLCDLLANDVRAERPLIP